MSKMSTPNLDVFNERADKAEKEIEKMKKDLEMLQVIIQGKKSENSDVEVAKLQQENVKLKHRITILKRALEVQRAKDAGSTANNQNTMPSIYETLYEVFKNAVESAYPDLVDPPVVIAPVTNNPKFGDYQCNSALPLCKLIKTNEKKVSPRDIANNIVSKVLPLPLIEKLEVAGAGFINVFLNRESGKNILNILLKAEKVPPPSVRKQRIVIDFSSPNVAKEMHVGHLRSTIIGDSIARLLEYLGHDVLRLNHIGDWGTQFGMLIAHLCDRFPDYLTTSPSISDLQSLYKESKARFDTDEEFKKRAYKCVVSLQAFEPDITKAWQLICDVTRKEIAKLYTLLDVRLTERGESFYQTKMEALVKELNSAGFLEEDEGRKIMWGENAEGIPFTIVKSDGGFTYDTSDMAALKHRVEEERADWLIYVTDAGQATHFQTLESCAKRAKFLTPRHRFDHVPFGVVLGEDKKKFKTRSGDTVKLIDLLYEGVKRSEQKLLEKGRDKVLTPEEMKTAKESIAYGCIKYADLSHDRVREYVFSFDKMLDDKGNTAVYLLYALMRISSIARTANVSQEQIQAALAEGTSVSLDHEKEWKLAKVLIKFPDVVLKTTKDLYLHHLCEYCYEIACAFTEFYDNCYCVEKNKSGEIVKVNMGRILLTEATAKMMKQCFSLLGLKPVSRM